MDKQFVTKEIAEALKELGFDEKCLAFYHEEKLWCYAQGYHDYGSFEHSTDFNYHNNKNCYGISAPLWQQVGDWFETEHNIIISILVEGQSQFNKRQFYVAVQIFIPHCNVYISVLRDEKDNILFFNTKHEARIVAFEKVIEIIKKRNG